MWVADTRSAQLRQWSVVHQGGAWLENRRADCRCGPRHARLRGAAEAIRSHRRRPRPHPHPRRLPGSSRHRPGAGCDRRRRRAPLRQRGCKPRRWQAACPHPRGRDAAGLRPQRLARARAARAGPGADPRRRPAVRDARCHRPRAGGARRFIRRRRRRSRDGHAQAGGAGQPHRRHARPCRPVAGANPARVPFCANPGRARSCRTPPARTT